MGSLAQWFGFSSSSSSDELPEIYPLPIGRDRFTDVDVLNIYTKILTDVAERTHGLSEDESRVLWDNCLQSETRAGLITLLAEAMSKQSELFLVYDKSTKVLRRAEPSEVEQIRADYIKQAESSIGVYVSFKNYARTEMVRLYSTLEHCTVSSLYKSMNLAKATQVKLSDLRKSTAAIDSADVKAQASKIATALAAGKDVMIDAEDTIENAKPDLTSAQTSIEFIAQKLGFYLDMPASYITGQAPKGLGDSGEGDARSVERGLKNYFVSIMQPVLKALFGKSVKFKSQDYRQINTTLEVLKTFEITSGELLSEDNKRMIINKMLGLDPDEKGDPPEKTPPPADPNNPPGAQPPKPNGGRGVA